MDWTSLKPAITAEIHPLLYIKLSSTFALLIGSLLLFASIALLMYATVRPGLQRGI